MVITAKKDGKPRKVVKVRGLKKFALRQTHSTEALYLQARRAETTTWRTTLDTWNGYRSIPLVVEDQWKNNFPHTLGVSPLQSSSSGLPCFQRCLRWQGFSYCSWTSPSSHIMHEWLLGLVSIYQWFLPSYLGMPQSHSISWHHPNTSQVLVLSEGVGVFMVHVGIRHCGAVTGDPGSH